jgi:hypothetical protein
MKIQIEAILNKSSMELVNYVVSHINKFETLTEVLMALKGEIQNLNLSKHFECGSGVSKLWLYSMQNGERILLITTKTQTTKPILKIRS